MTTALTFTPPQVAKRWRCSPDRVRDLIRTGNLEAFNMAEPGERPQYRVSAEAVARFERSRSVTGKIPTTKPTRRRRPAGAVKSFV